MVGCFLLGKDGLDVAFAELLGKISYVNVGRVLELVVPASPLPKALAKL